MPQVSGRGNRARFCQDGKTWGTRNLSCRDAEAALVDVESLRDETVAVDDVSVAALGEQIGRVLEPARALVEALTGVQQQLETTVAAALAERDRADEDANEQRRLRGIAEVRATEAVENGVNAENAMIEAVRLRVAAVRGREADRKARAEAEQAQLRIEGRAAALQDEVARMGARADAAAAHTADLDRALAAANADIDGLRSRNEEERERLAVATARAHAAESKSAADLVEHAVQLDALRTETQQQLGVMRAETQRLRDQFDQEQRTVRVAHEAALGALHTSINTLNRDLGAAELVRQQSIAEAVAFDARLRHLARLFADRGTKTDEVLLEEVHSLLDQIVDTD